MMDQVDFLEKYKRIREASETVLLMESPRRWGKSWLGMEVLKQRKNSGIKLFSYAKGWTQERKLLRSSSKQSRMVSVVCK